MSLSEAARPAVAEMRRHHAEPVIGFLRELDEDQAEAFISNLTLLLACLREETTAARSDMS